MTRYELPEGTPRTLAEEAAAIHVSIRPGADG